MTDVRDFEGQLRAALQAEERAARMPADLPERLVTNTPVLVRDSRRAGATIRRIRWLPPALAAAAVAVVIAAATLTTVLVADRHTPATTPLPSVRPTPTVQTTPTVRTTPTVHARPTVRAAPTATQIRAILGRTIEDLVPSEHFRSLAAPVTIGDGHGGTLTAVLAGRTPSADGKGTLVSFWHDGTFVGWDSDQEALATRSVTRAGSRTFAITYPNYAASDAACCPTLPEVTVDFVWDGRELVAQRSIPRGVYGLNNVYTHPVLVHLLPRSGGPTSPWTLPQLLITPNSLGSVARGMTPAAAEAAAGTPLTLVGDGIRRAARSVTGATQLSLWQQVCFDASRVGSGPGTTVLTAAGVGLGDAMSLVRRVYGSSAVTFRADPNWTGPGNVPAGITVTTPNGVLLFVGSSGSTGTITSIRAAADAFVASSVFC